MRKEVEEEFRVRVKLVVLELADHLGVSIACREFNVPRSSFYRWKQKYEKAGRSGLYRARPIAYRHPRRTSPDVVEKILALRAEYQFGALRIMYYLDRYHGIKISESTVSRVLKAHGLNRLPTTALRRALHSQRYAKTVPGHYVQVDVKFLQLEDREGRTVKGLCWLLQSSARLREVHTKVLFTDTLFHLHTRPKRFIFGDSIVHKQLNTFRLHFLTIDFYYSPLVFEGLVRPNMN